MPMNSSYRVSRDPHQRFRGKDTYFTKDSGTNQPRFCHVMQRPADALRLVNGVRRAEKSDEWEGFPWLTMIFGSGALRLPDESGVTAEALAAGVQAALENSEAWGAAAYGDQAQRFTRALVYARTGEKPGPGAQEPETLSVEPRAAELVCLVAMLTGVFHLVQAGGDVPVGRWDDEAATFGKEEQDRWPSLRWEELERLVDDAQTLLEHLLAGPAPDPDAEDGAIAVAVHTILREVASGLDPKGRARKRSIRLDQVRMLTEVSWYHLARGTPIYPGWTDLLVNLSLQGTGPNGVRRPRPSFPNLRQLPRSVEQIYLPPTERSWQVSAQGQGGAQRLGGVTAEVVRRDDLYEGAAEVLWAQAEANAGRVFSEQLPPAAAFVTSFDAELDMALWVTGEDRFFRVVLPVHLVQPHESKEAELCWLMGEVHVDHDATSSEQLAQLRRPTNWQLLTPQFDATELRRVPIVIHLSGCPLFRLPDPARPADREDIARLVSALEDVGVTVLPGQADFEHAVTVDEYLALRQSEVELLWLGTGSDRVIHPDLVINSLSNPRFWLLMGVPVGDAAIRHRLVSQLTRLRINEASRPVARPLDAEGSLLGDPDGESLLGDPDGLSLLGESPPEGAPETGRDPETSVPLEHGGPVSGVAVNTRIGDDEANLLFWVGLDVVDDDCRDFLPDLQHYAAHVRQPGKQKIPDPTMPCKVQGKGHR